MNTKNLKNSKIKKASKSFLKRRMKYILDRKTTFQVQNNISYEKTPTRLNLVKVIAPTENGIRKCMRFSWKCSGGSACYELALKNLRLNSWKYINDVKRPYLEYHESLNEGEYLWKVRLRGNETSAWSPHQRFHISMNGDVNIIAMDLKRAIEEKADCKGNRVLPPVLISFKDHIADTKPLFRWKKVKGAMSYALSVKNIDSGKATFFYNIKDTKFSPKNELMAGTCKWFIKAILPEGQVTSRPQIIELVERRKLDKILQIISSKKNKNRYENQKFLDYGKNLTYETNKALKAEEIRDKKIKLKSFPLTMLFNIGHNCNIDCVMCKSGRVFDHRIMPEYFIKDLDNYLPFLDNLLLSGGEPFVYRRKMEDLYNKSLRYENVKIGVHTNGQIIDDTWIKRLCSGKFSSLSISIDASTKETYNSIRKKASFDKIIYLLREIKKLNANTKPTVTLNFVVMKRNVHEMVSFTEMAQEFGVQEVNFQVMRHTMLPELRNENILFDKDSIKNILKNLSQIDLISVKHGINIVDKVSSFIYNTYPDLCQNLEDQRYLPEYISTIGLEENIDDRVMSLMLQRKPEMGLKRIIPELKFNKNALKKNGFFCIVPFENMNVDIEESLICCNCMRSFYFFPYDKTWNCLHDIWNSKQYQDARGIMLEGREAERLCNPICAYYHKGGYVPLRDKYLWV